MPDVEASLEFLARLPLYETEKPYLMLPQKGLGLDPDNTRLDNLEFERHDQITIKDLRGEDHASIESCGFEVYRHSSCFNSFNSVDDIDGYKSETESMLRKRFTAAHVVTYDTRLRRNEDFGRREVDLTDKLIVEGPAKGAHVDATFVSGPQIIQRYLSEDEQTTYLRPGFRARICNTWRPLIEELEDRPLALCDSRTVAPNDLVAADRVLPDAIGEIYFLQYEANQRWYWLEKQRMSELLLFLAYDTHSRAGAARFCPHVSFDNPKKGPAATTRSSIETRSIVITADG